MSEELVRCPLCGFRFPGRASCPTGCPFSGACRSFCCPNCHYRFILTAPITEKVLSWLRRKAQT